MGSPSAGAGSTFDPSAFRGGYPEPAADQGGQQSPQAAARGIGAGGQQVASVLHSIAGMIRSKGQGLAQTLGSLAQQFGGSMGHVLGGLFDIAGAFLEARKKQPQLKDMDYEQVANFARSLSYSLSMNPASAGPGGRFMLSGASQPAVTVKVDVAPGAAEFVKVTGQSHLAKLNIAQGVSGG